jgi:hypothetical protein
MVAYPTEADFLEPHRQILVRKGDKWDVLHVAAVREAMKYQFGMSTLFFHVDEWRKID